MKRALRQPRSTSRQLPALQEIAENRTVRILSLAATVLLIFNLAVIPMVQKPHKPKISAKESSKIGGMVREVLQAYDIDLSTLSVVDTLTEVPVPADFQLYDFYNDVRVRLKKGGAEVIEVKRARSSQIVMSVGKRGVPVEHFLFKPRRISRATSGSVAIIIDDFGYSFNKTIRDFLTLEAPLTISIIPGLDYSRKVADAAGINRKEVIVHMPMEPLNEPFKDDGYILLTSHDAGTISMRLRKAFAELPVAAGLNNHQGSKATGDARVMSAAMATLKQLNKFFVDSSTGPESVVERTAKQAGVRSARNELFLDAKDDAQFIRNRLLETAERAKKNEHVIVIGHARSRTLAVFKEMMPKLTAMGVTVVPVSQLLN